MTFRLKPHLIAVAIATCISLASFRASRAEHITFHFTGTIQSIFDGLAQLDGSVAVGSVFTGAYTFDPATPNTTPGVSEGEAGLYEHDAPPAGVTIDVGDFTFRSVPIAPEFDVIVNNDFGFAGSDDYGFTSHNNESSGLPDPDLVDRLDIRWFAQSFNNPFNSVELPVTPPDLSQLGGGLLTIRGECTPCAGPAAFFEMQGALTSLTPEPSSWSLLVLGATFFRRQRGAKNTPH